MHMLGIPKTMQEDPFYQDLLPEISAFFEERIGAAVDRGVKRANLILDPGIGFGKRHQDNLCLLKHLRFLERLELPLLVGASRKSFLGRILDDAPAEERLEGTIAASLISMLHGAHILRVHDVAAIKKAVTVAEEIVYNTGYCGSAGSGGTDRTYDVE
jgi:dihydropteroate synthase